MNMNTCTSIVSLIGSGLNQDIQKVALGMFRL